MSETDVTSTENGLRRTLLAVPGSDEEAVAKAPDSGADEVFLDLEDAVAPNRKVAARENVIEGLTDGEWSDTRACYRINGIHTEWWYNDVIEVVSEAGTEVETLIVPMVRDSHAVSSIDHLLTQVEINSDLPEGGIGLHCQIETGEGITNVEAIAGASDRIEAVIFGPGDYAANVGAAGLTVGGGAKYPGHYWHYQIARVVAAAAAHDVGALDGPYADIDDGEGLRESCRWAAQLGCGGKMVIHPDQIGPTNEVFTPDAEEAEKAKRIVSEYEQALEEGEGAVRVDDEMVDAATYEMAKNSVSKAKRAGEL